MTKISMVKSSGRFASRTTNAGSVLTSHQNPSSLIDSNKIGITNQNQNQVRSVYLNQPRVIEKEQFQHPHPVSFRSPSFRNNTWVKRYCPWVLLAIGGLLFFGMLVALSISLARKDRDLALKNEVLIQNEIGKNNQKIKQQTSVPKRQNTIVIAPEVEPLNKKEPQINQLVQKPKETTIGRIATNTQDVKNITNSTTADAKQSQKQTISNPQIQKPKVNQNLQNNTIVNDKKPKNNTILTIVQPIQSKSPQTPAPPLPTKVEPTPTIPKRPYKKFTKQITVSEVYQKLQNEQAKEQDIKIQLAKIPKHLKRHYN